jgi:replicative DNA helicase
MNQKASFSKYGKSFQEDLCHLILNDRPFADRIFEVLDVNFLELKYLRVFVDMIRNHKEKYKIHPNYKVMISIIKSGLGEENDAVKKQVVDYAARIMAKPSIDNAEFIKDTSLDFCRKQKLKEAMIKSARLINESSFDEITTLISEAIKLGSSNDFGHDYLADFEKRYELKTRSPVTTNWAEVDRITGGGLGSSELGVVVAPTGAGKSMVLAHLGATAVKAGKTVVHYTLELADTVVGQRYDSCITGVKLNELFQYKDLIKDTVENIDGTLIVKEYPTKTASVETLRNHIERLIARDLKPDLVIVDYGDLLKPVNKNREKRVELESIYEGLRSLAQQFKCPVWTASQTNRSGLNAEVITMESISEAFSKCFVADFIFTVSRTIEDKQNDAGRIFVAKNRFGPDGLVFPIEMRTSNVFIDVKPMQTMTSSGQVMSNLTASTQSDILKEKYKKFRQQKKDKKQNGEV